MHNMNVKGIFFSGKEGKNAVKQILKAKTVKNEFTTTVSERSKKFIQNFKSLPPFELTK